MQMEVKTTNNIVIKYFVNILNKSNPLALLVYSLLVINLINTLLLPSLFFFFQCHIQVKPTNPSSTKGKKNKK